MLPNFESNKPTYTITQLTQAIKGTLESEFNEVWLTGEISNFHAHGSGHFYFTLKDEKSQISAVMFRGANRNLKFLPENGLEVLAQGRVSVYEPRGTYQVILEFLEPKGIGALQLAFEQMRDRLQAAGWFDPAIKKPLPFLPRTIGIVTSPTGAVIRDMLHILKRRFPTVSVLLHPVAVQGAASAPEIARAIATLSARPEVDVLIVGRGGGSLEDLWAFNTEEVARAIFECPLPVISAVGHETDVTIADFVADLRAPTPSAAAELVVPLLEELEMAVREQRQRLQRAFARTLQAKAQQLKFWTSHLKHPKRFLEEKNLYLDELGEHLQSLMRQRLLQERQHLGHLAAQLQALSPLSILGRGYAIVRREVSNGQYEVLRRAEDAHPKDKLLLKLQEGELQAQVLGSD